MKPVDQHVNVNYDLSQLINEHTVVQRMLYVATYCEGRIYTVQLGTHGF